MNNDSSQQILNSPDFGEVLALLKSAGLPTDDLNSNQMLNFVQLRINDQLAGIGGLEILGDMALLRSLVCSPVYRGQGVGKALVKELEQQAVDNGIGSLYLLTNTAEAFFQQLGYQTVSRADVPEAIKSTREFSELCPDSAVVMARALS